MTSPFANASEPTGNPVGICCFSPHHHHKCSATELDLQTDLCEAARIQPFLL